MNEFRTLALLDDKNRYWEVDLVLHDGSQDVYYNGTVLPGDEAGFEILGGAVEVKSRSGKTKATIKVGPEQVESRFSDTKLLRAL